MNQFRKLYSATQLPVFQNRMYRTKSEAMKCLKGDVVLVQDMKTGLIFNQAFRPELVEYDSDYQNEQAVSLSFRSHLSDVAEIVKDHFQHYSLIEVGCGKGFFLEYIRELGFDITGFDPTYEGQSQNIIKKYFTPDIELTADGIILRHVLEHIQNPVAFLSAILESNGGTGKVYIEVPCFDWICQNNAWFDIFYEHVNYFRIEDFNRIFGKVYESGHIFGGQYLYIVADLATLQSPVYDEQCYLEFPEDFDTSVTHYAEKLKCCTNKYSVIWGGASKGVIFSIYMQRAGVNIDFVVDINPAKQGKYLPITGYLVQAPGDIIKKLNKSSDIFVMNSNYLEEIKLMTNNQFNYISVDHENI